MAADILARAWDRAKPYVVTAIAGFLAGALIFAAIAGWP